MKNTINMLEQVERSMRDFADVDAQRVADSIENAMQHHPAVPDDFRVMFFVTTSPDENPSDRYYCTRLLGFRLPEDQYVQELIDAGMDWAHVATCLDEQFPPSEEPDPETALVVSAGIAMLERVKAEMRPPDAEVLSYVFVKTPHDGNVMMTFYTGTRH